MGVVPDDCIDSGLQQFMSQIDKMLDGVGLKLKPPVEAGDQDIRVFFLFCRFYLVFYRRYIAARFVEPQMVDQKTFFWRNFLAVEGECPRDKGDANAVFSSARTSSCSAWFRAVPV